jgi:hypothetical protein
MSVYASVHSCAELPVVPAQPLQQRHEAVGVGRLRDNPAERREEPVALDGHRHREHAADLGMSKKQVRVKEQRHLVAVGRHARKVPLQAFRIQLGFPHIDRGVLLASSTCMQVLSVRS